MSPAMWAFPRPSRWSSRQPLNRSFFKIYPRPDRAMLDEFTITVPFKQSEPRCLRPVPFHLAVDCQMPAQPPKLSRAPPAMAVLPANGQFAPTDVRGRVRATSNRPPRTTPTAVLLSVICRPGPTHNVVDPAATITSCPDIFRGPNPWSANPRYANGLQRLS